MFKCTEVEQLSLKVTIVVEFHAKDKDNKPVNQWHALDVRSSDIWGYRLIGKQGQTPKH